MFPVRVCLRIKPERFVEEGTERKRRPFPRFAAGQLCAEVLPIAAARGITVWLLRGIPRLRFAPLGMTELT